MTTIFDIGSNKGSDIPYYLLKADRVVAFEANPRLCDHLAAQYSSEIASGRLVIEAGVLITDADAQGPAVDFYVHKRHHVLSQLPRPSDELLPDFTVETIPVRRLSDALARHGEPLYAKIDIEHYDQHIVAEFFRLGVYPAYLSAECHSAEVAQLMLACPAYTGFKLVEGARVSSDYSHAVIRTAAGEFVECAFPAHSAGPFGEDIEGPWYERSAMADLLANRGLGWRDLHASRRDVGQPVAGDW